MLRVADEVWVATALLHLENPGREDFSISEIVERAMKEKLGGGFRPGLPVHASNHCVASKSPNPARLRMLSETGRGRRRLFRAGDAYHPDRKGGRTRPDKADLPPKLDHLVDWYEKEYVPRGSPEPGRRQVRGGSVAALRKIVGTISPEDLKSMQDAIGDCERVNPDEW